MGEKGGKSKSSNADAAWDGCIKVVGALLMVPVLLVGCVLVYNFVSFMTHQILVMQQRAHWDAAGLTDYIVIVHNVGTGVDEQYVITVQDGVVTCAGCDEGVFDAQDPMDRLFTLAANCTEMFCSVQWESKLGYPTSIHSGFSEFNLTRITVYPK